MSVLTSKAHFKSQTLLKNCDRCIFIGGLIAGIYISSLKDFSCVLNSCAAEIHIVEFTYSSYKSNPVWRKDGRQGSFSLVGGIFAFQ